MTSAHSNSGEIEKVRKELEALRSRLRGISPDGHMTLIERVLYGNLPKQIRRCTKRLKELEQAASSPPSIGLENLETDQGSTNKSIQTYPHFPKDILEKVALVDDLGLILNNFHDESITTLQVLRHLYRTLDTFDRRFLLIRNPTADHFQILRQVVQETSVTYLAQCNDTKMLHYLLRLYEGADSVQFANSVEVLDAFLVEGNKGPEGILRQDWARHDFLSRPISAALQRLVDRGQLSAERLLSLVNVEAITKEQYELVVQLLFGHLALEELVPLEEQLQHFMERMHLRDYAVHKIGTPDAWEGCIALSQESPLFAQWFIYNELLNLPENAQEKFLSNLQSITNVLRAYEPSDELEKHTSPVLLATIRDDWQGENFTSFVEKQPSNEPLGKRLHEIQRRRTTESLSNGGIGI